MKVMAKEQTAENEIKLIHGLEHPNIVKYFEHFELDIKEYGLVEIKLCIVTEICQV